MDIRIRDVQKREANAEFDTVMWSQMFFPAEARKSTIDSLMHALKPGGFLVMPLVQDAPDPNKVEPTLAMTTQLLNAIASRRWATYVAPSHEIQSELESFGFAHLYTIPNRRTPYMVMQRGK